MDTIREPGEVVARALRAVEGARTLDAALAALVGSLADRFAQLSRVSVRVLVPGGRTLVIVGLWSAAETSLGPGSMMSILSSSYPEMIHAGRSILADETPDPVMRDVLRAEGIRSWASIPLRTHGAIVAMLSLSSKLPTAFVADDVALLDALGAALEEGFIALAENTGFYPS